ncbi:MAG: extracellular solute-binding protein [Chloroflexi bacterium]|nr:extracellular solute-binding protein [Chloroflexota bacterium]MBP7041344.1 extracellular solute-binding protein [Chloroflexota bacterium]
MARFNRSLLYLFIIIVGLFVIGCTPSGSEANPSAKEPVTITFYKRGYIAGSDDATSSTNAQAVAAFEKSHPNINVEIIGLPWNADGDAQLLAALESGKNIHVFSARPVDLINLAKNENISDIAPFLTNEDKTDFYANALQAATIDEKIAAWPIWVVVSSVFVNTDIFAERGVPLPSLDDPWTWNEFVAAAQQLTYVNSSGQQIYGFTAASTIGEIGYYPIVYADGGRILSPDGKRFVLNQPEALSGLQKVADLRNGYGVTPPDFGDVGQTTTWEQFKNGEVAILMSTPALIAELESINFPFAIVPPPMGDLNQVITTGAFGMYGVYQAADEAELAAAHEFARYITGSQVALDVPGYQLAPSLRRSNESYATTPSRKMVSRLVEFGIFEPPANISAEVSSLYGAALQAVILGEKTPKEAMDEIAPLYQAELDASWQK